MRMPYGGWYPHAMTGSPAVTPNPEPKCDDCKRYVKALEDITRVSAAWTAVAIAKKALGTE